MTRLGSIGGPPLDPPDDPHWESAAERAREELGDDASDEEVSERADMIVAQWEADAGEAQAEAREADREFWGD
jgi:hypothetical protein